MKKDCILVLGAHRSGTSALTRTLSLLGADLPTNLLDPQPDNPTGFWESRDHVTLNDQLLAALGLRWDSLLSSRWDLLNSASFVSYRDRIIELLHRDFESSRLFVVKDPRLCRLLPVWRSALERFDAEPKCILIVRHPLEVAASLTARNRLPLQNGLLMWLRYLLEAEGGSNDLHRVFVSYEQLLTDWRAEVLRISQILNIEWLRTPAEAAREIDEFLQRNAQHHLLGEISADGTGPIPAVRKAYEIACAATRCHTTEASPEFDELQAFVSESESLIRPIISESRRLAVDNEHFSADIVQRDSQLQELALESRRLAADNEQLRTDVVRRDSQLQELALESRRLAADNEQLRTDVVQRNSLLQEFASESRRLAADNEQLRGNTLKLRQLLSAYEQQLSDKSRTIANLQERALAVGAELKWREGQVAEALAIREQLRTNSQQMSQKINQLSTELFELRRSASWQVTAPLRETYRSWDRLRRALSPHKYRFRLQATSQLRPLDSAQVIWEAEGSAPQFLLIPSSRARRFPVRWCEFEIELHHPDGVQQGILCVDYGTGFTADSSILLPPHDRGQLRVAIELGRGIRGLRLSPRQGAGRFEIGDVVIREITRRRAKQLKRRLTSGICPASAYVPPAVGGALVPIQIPAAEPPASRNAALEVTQASGGEKIAGESTPPFPESSTDEHQHRESASAREFEAKVLVRDRLKAELAAFLESGAEFALPRSHSPVTSIVLVLYNSAELTYNCLTSIVAHAGEDTETIILDNASTDATAQLLTHVRGAIIVHNIENRYFPPGCNQASQYARGKYLLFLNNDAHLLPGSLQAAVGVLQEDETIGAVGGRILNLTGCLQEAGSILWSDGSAVGYGRGDISDHPKYMFRREVDFCSAAFLVTRTKLFREMGGFDEVFSPGYYEEVDFCARLWEQNLRVIYEPRAAIVHFEYGSSDSASAVELMTRNQRIIRLKHAEYLASRKTPDPGNELRARHSRAPRLRILFVDDCIPHRDQGAGYPRANAIANAMVRLGAAVTLFPLVHGGEPWHRIYRDLSREIEVMADASADSLSAFLEERNGLYDAVFVSRPHNMRHFLNVIEDKSFPVRSRLIYDAEAVFALRAQEKAHLLGEHEPEVAARELKEELDLAGKADEIVCVSEFERRHLVEYGLGPVHILGHCLEPKPTVSTFEDRHNILFVGAMNSPDSPNEDSVLWFSKHVLPRVRARLASEDIRLVVVGQNTVQRLSALADDPALELVGSVEDLSSYYEQARIFVAPARFAAGIPIKVLDAAAHALPIVATSNLASQLGWIEDDELLTAPSTDPEKYADQCARLYSEKELWSRLRARALARAQEDCSTQRFEENLRRILVRSSVIKPNQREIGTPNYADWIQAYDTLTDTDRAAIRNRIRILERRPIISLVISTLNTTDRLLRESVQSVQRQLYPHWQLCIVDNASTTENVSRVVKHFAAGDDRVMTAVSKDSGSVTCAHNHGLGRVTGEYIACLNPGDRLSEHALYWVVEEINAHPAAQVIYSDSDSIDTAGGRHDPYFKSDWNPDLLLSQNYIGRLAVYQSERILQIGGFREGVEGADDWDLLLRFTRALDPSQICHIPQILHHRHSSPDPRHVGNSRSAFGWEAGRKALEFHLNALGIDAEVLPACHGVYHRVRYVVEEPLPLVSIIIPTRNAHSLLGACLDSIRSKTDYPSYELIIVDNQSTDADTLVYLADLQQSGVARILPYDAPFNWSGIHNASVPLANGQLICLLNNDVEVIASEWLREMVSHALRPAIGAVGAKLLYRDGTVQHAGVILGMWGLGAGHAHKHLSGDAAGYHGRAAVVQNISAVTGACMMFRKPLFEEVGGMDEWNLPTSYNDVDFCLRLLEKGYRNVWTPYAVLHHYESKTRGTDDTATKRRRAYAELYYFHQKWGHLVCRDPYYNPNLTLSAEDFSLAEPPRNLPFSHGTLNRVAP